MNALDLQSEPYSHYGNISADGVHKLLGTPNQDRLQTMVRESVQNSWDARLADAVPTYALRVRTIQPPEAAYLRARMFGHRPRGDDQELIASLRRPKLRVLEVCDFGTSGLGGPALPGDVPAEGESPDFVDFLRNIGTPRDTVMGGGTYGYGKSSLYALSRCSTIFVDSQAWESGREVRRIMACRVGQRHDVVVKGEKKRFTGRHWWGRAHLGDASALLPIEGQEAAMLSRRLGLPPRDATLSGTTIVILDPDLDGLEDEELGQHMVETLLWNFWPKLVTDHGAPTMRFSVEVDGVAFDIPSVEDCPPFHLFAQALRALRENSEEAEVLSCLRPKKTIGRIAFVRDMHLNRSGAVDRPSSQVPRHCRHVALMRPAELVVKYVEGHPLPDTAVEWAGVFKCDENPEVERAFAAAEPPAHDDWNPQYLPARSRERTYVNVGLKRIRQAIESFSAPAPPPMVSQQAESVAGVGDRLGGMLSTPGQGLGGNRGGGGGGGTPRKVRVGRPEFLELRRIQDKSVAVFAVPVKGPVGASVRLTGRAGVVIEGGKTIDVDPDGNQVAVLQWEAGDSFVASGESVEVGLTADTVLRAVVELTGPWAVRLRVTHEAI